MEVYSAKQLQELRILRNIKRVLLNMELLKCKDILASDDLYPTTQPQGHSDDLLDNISFNHRRTTPTRTSSMYIQRANGGSSKGQGSAGSSLTPNTSDQDSSAPSLSSHSTPSTYQDFSLRSKTTIRRRQSIHEPRSHSTSSSHSRTHLSTSHAHQYFKQHSLARSSNSTLSCHPPKYQNKRQHGYSSATHTTDSSRSRSCSSIQSTKAVFGGAIYEVAAHEGQPNIALQLCRPSLVVSNTPSHVSRHPAWVTSPLSNYSRETTNVINVDTYSVKSASHTKEGVSHFSTTIKHTPSNKTSGTQPIAEPNSGHDTTVNLKYSVSPAVETLNKQSHLVSQLESTPVKHVGEQLHCHRKNNLSFYPSLTKDKLVGMYSVEGGDVLTHDSNQSLFETQLSKDNGLGMINMQVDALLDGRSLFACSSTSTLYFQKPKQKVSRKST